MRSFLESGDTVGGWNLFMSMFENMTDEARMLIYADWLEEHGFTECSGYLRHSVDKETPHPYYARMANELKQHGMKIDDNILTWNDQKLRVNHHQIEVNRNGKWTPVNSKSNVHEAAPGLAMILAANIHNTADTHEKRILYSFMGRYSIEMLNFANAAARAETIGSNLSPFVLKGLVATSRKIEHLLNKIPDKTDERLRMMLSSIQARAVQIEQRIEAQFNNPSTQAALTTLRHLMAVIAQIVPPD